MIYDNLWYLIFAALFVGFLFIYSREKSKRRYLVIFVSGCVFGLYFDIVSFTNGWYSYPDFYVDKIFGLPFSMIIAEGFSVAIVVRLSEYFRKFFRI